MGGAAGSGQFSLAELCIVAAAEAWRRDGEVLATGIGLVPRLAASLAKLTFNPELLITDGEAFLVSEPVPVGPRDGYRPRIEGWMPYRRVFENLWSGRRHAMVGPTQIDRYGAANISCIGDPARPRAQLLGVRGFPGNTIHHPNSFFIPDHSARVFVEKVDMASSVGYDPARFAPGVKRDFVDLRLVVSNLAVLDFRGPGRTLRLVSVHPGVSPEAVQERTGFALALAPELGQTPAPTAQQLDVIRRVIDPHGLREGVFAP